MWIIVIFIEIAGDARGAGLEGKIRAVLKVLFSMDSYSSP